MNAALRPRARLALSLLLAATFDCTAAPNIGQLFYTPQQRAMLNQARARKITEVHTPTPAADPAPQRYDGLVVRSDGQSTRWVNGKAQVGASSISGLKPGQIRAQGRVYEPYQVLRTDPGVTP